MLTKDPLETPYSVQLAGNNPTVVANAVKILNDIDGIDIIDFNLGCPATKIVSHGSGSALLKDLTLVSEILSAIKSESKKNQNRAKIRIGYETKNGIEIAKVCEDAGMDFIAVHGRTRSGKFHSEVDYDSIKDIKSELKIPVIANGDIDSYEKAKWVIEHTKSDGVMIGRGSIGNPWIFYQLKYNSSIVTDELKREIVLEHFDAMLDFYDDAAVSLFRKHLHSYSKNHREAASFRSKVNHINSVNDMREEIGRFFLT
jgi:tRNA-dihydrouridine synthase B